PGSHPVPRILEAVKQAVQLHLGTRVGRRGGTHRLAAPRARHRRQRRVELPLLPRVLDDGMQLPPAALNYGHQSPSPPERVSVGATFFASSTSSGFVIDSASSTGTSSTAAAYSTCSAFSADAG